MALEDRDWRRIQKLIDDFARTVPQYFSQGEVVSVDQSRKVIFLKEFGDQPIPLFSFEFDVDYIDTGKHQNAKLRHTIATPRLPKKGDIVLVARQMGSRRLPKCIGVLQSHDFVDVGSD